MIDRNKELDFQEINMPSFITPKTIHLDNGLNVYFIEDSGQELCRLDMVFYAGTKVQNKPLQATLCNALLFEGTNNKKGSEIHEVIDFYGAYTQLDINADRSTISLYSLNKYFDIVFPVFIDAINNAIFPEEAFQIILSQKKQLFDINYGKVEFLARSSFFKTIFNDHSYGDSISQNDFKNISRDDIVHFHNNFYKNVSPEVYIAGKIPENALSILDQSFGESDINHKSSVKQFVSLVNNNQQIHLEKDGALQTAIKIGRCTFNSSHEDFYQLKFLSVVLGGYFRSRLMKNIRENKGLTYGVFSTCVQNEESGYFCISTDVKSECTQLALKEIYYELKQLRSILIPPNEMELVKNYIMGQILKSADGSFAQINLLKNIHLQGIGFEFYHNYKLTLDQLNPYKLKEIANKYFKKEDLCEVLVGKVSF